MCGGSCPLPGICPPISNLWLIRSNSPLSNPSQHWPHDCSLLLHQPGLPGLLCISRQAFQVCTAFLAGLPGLHCISQQAFQVCTASGQAFQVCISRQAFRVCTAYLGRPSRSALHVLAGFPGLHCISRQTFQVCTAYFGRPSGFASLGRSSWSALHLLAGLPGLYCISQKATGPLCGDEGGPTAAPTPRSHAVPVCMGAGTPPAISCPTGARL